MVLIGKGPWRRPLAIFVLVFGFSFVCSDIPVNCTFEDARGEWLFYETERSFTSDLNCSEEEMPFTSKQRIKLEYPNSAIDDYGNNGTWTLIYNEGFEIRVRGRSYFAFFYYNMSGNVATSFCDETFTGWSRDMTVRNWGCFKGKKVTHVQPKIHVRKKLEESEKLYRRNPYYIDSINEVQNNWTATAYPEYEEMTLMEMQLRAGGKRVTHRIGPARPSFLSRFASMMLPQDFDWRNVSGVNYVSPVRNQGRCGSCYAFSSMAGLEARVRILTRNEEKPIFSVQDILECSNYSQGCDGGFPYLVAGRYSQDFGVVLEECSKYVPERAQNVCTTNPKCLRHYTAYYRYVGGYYGACNEELMKLALLKGGPLMVGLEVYSDLFHYKKGIYHHTTMITDHFNPWEETNHAVLVVGYGVDKATKERFWSVKNSWGREWGEDGYFRIRRGTDECGIESMAFEVVPIPA